jgi:exonuclease SbcC
MAELCRLLDQPEISTSETISAAIQRLDAHVTAREAAANDRQTRRRGALAEYRRFQQLEAEIAQLQQSQSSDEALKRRQQSAFDAAERHRHTARTVIRAASTARTAIVGRVFNSSLNKVWRDLFVRLAPTEPFVPAFRLPQNNSEPVSAQLETVHREGGSGGAPGAMLSAGNLNTAALTLFLALHLSVKPQLPWLILDDPVQSMDEVHIAQFAALLRTLSKEHHRQMIVAVHERNRRRRRRPHHRPERVEQQRAAEAKMRRAGFPGHHPPRDKEHHLARRKCRRESTPQTPVNAAFDQGCWRRRPRGSFAPIARAPSSL